MGSSAKVASGEYSAAYKSIRHFNRYYTNRLGLLARYRFDTKLTLTEARVLFEIGRRGAHTQRALGAELKLDGGYLNRVVGRLAAAGLVERRVAETDARVVLLELSEEGREVSARINEASDAEAASLIARLGEAEARELVGHMRAIERLLEGRDSAVPRVESVERGPAVASVRALMREYVQSLGEDLSFQEVERELAGLPGKYAAPGGALFMARAPAATRASAGGEPAGCVGLRPLGEGACEMKRLYVRPEYRGYGLGRALALRAIEAARGLGYGKMRLDTLERLEEATALYRALGFARIEPYCENPLPGATFWELALTQEIRPRSRMQDSVAYPYCRSRNSGP